jgi:beta-barrel assembly-enhancing protease
MRLYKHSSIRQNLICTMLLSAPFLWGQTGPRDFQFSPPDEKLLQDANELDKQYEKKGLLYRDPAAEGYLESIGKGLLEGAPPPDRVTYRFRILRDPMVNAFALPNGSLYVNTGLVAALESEAELASVLGHEITHVTDRHTYLLNRNIRKKAMTMQVMGAVAASAGYFPAGAIFGNSIAFASTVSQVIIISTVYGYSQDLERDADTSGYARLIRANYDGAAMARSLELLDEKLEYEPTQPFWRTHPKLQERIVTAEKLTKTENRAQPRVVSESDYLDHMASVIRYNAVMDLDSRRSRTALARTQRLVNWDPNSGVNRTLLADAYRSLGAKTAQPGDNESSPHGKATVRRQMLKLTAEEEQKALLATPTGARTLESNQSKAESLYHEAIAIDPALPDPHQGLGMLYEDQAKYAEALHEYRTYLDLAPPQAPDRLRIERRLEASKSALEGTKK